MSINRIRKERDYFLGLAGGKREDGIAEEKANEEKKDNTPGVQDADVRDKTE